MEDKLTAGWFKYPEYYPALHLALNAVVGGLTIHDAIFNEDRDVWYVELTDESASLGGRYYDLAFQLKGKFVRSCYKAYKGGMRQWIPKT
jgi:hypothetical protein